MSDEKESGAVFDDEAFVGFMLRAGGSWLRAILVADPDAECGCGSCWLCMYRYGQRMMSDRDSYALKLDTAEKGYRDMDEQRYQAVRNWRGAQQEIDALQSRLDTFRRATTAEAISRYIWKGTDIDGVQTHSQHDEIAQCVARAIAQVADAEEQCPHEYAEIPDTPDIQSNGYSVCVKCGDLKAPDVQEQEPPQPPATKHGPDCGCRGCTTVRALARSFAVEKHQGTVCEHGIYDGPCPYGCDSDRQFPRGQDGSD